MRIQLNNYYRVMHTLSGLTYLFPSYKLYTQNKKIGSALYFNSAIASAIWSLTSYGGMNGNLVKIDVFLAYLIVIYNYYTSFDWIKEKTWSKNHKKGFILTHFAALIFIIENILINLNIHPKLTYGIMHFIWRIISSLGSYYIISISNKITKS